MGCGRTNNFHTLKKMILLVKLAKNGFFVVSIVLLVLVAYGATPPWPHGISGFIFYSSGTQVPNGIPYSLNDTNNSFYYKDETSTPVPGYTGWYSVVVDGTDGDIINFLAWNSTHYGEKNFTLIGDMEVNITINKTRPPEINLSIIEPENNTAFNLSSYFIVNVSINVLGNADATNCNFTISFNSSVLALAAGESYTHFIATITKASIVYEAWNLTSIAVGTSNITVNSSCSSDDKNFDGLTEDTVTNITIVDNVAPVVRIASPKNNTAELGSNTIVFSFNVSDGLSILNCTLYVNKTYKNHTDSPQKDTMLNLSTTLSNGLYNWSINCTDASYNTGSSGRYNLSVAVYTPHITQLEIENPVNLLAGTNKELRCNGSAEDGNGYSNIIAINATFYFIAGGYNSFSPDNNNSHYTTSCTMSNQFGNSLDFDCVFNLTYYASPGEWQCNVSIIDAQSHTNASTINTNVSELLAIGLPGELDFGVTLPGQASQEKSINIENQGNVAINISVRGYGKQEYDNLSMVCTSGNISITLERYNTTQGKGFDEMYNLTPGFTKIPDFVINKSNGTSSIGTVYWRVKPGFGISGSCNGTLIFSVVV